MNVRTLEVTDPCGSATFILIHRLPNLQWLHLYSRHAHRSNIFFTSMYRLSSLRLLTIAVPVDWYSAHLVRLVSYLPGLVYLNCGPDFRPSITPRYAISPYKPKCQLQCLVMNVIPLPPQKGEKTTQHYLYSILLLHCPNIFRNIHTCVLLMPNFWTAKPLLDTSWIPRLLSVIGTTVRELDLDFWHDSLDLPRYRSLRLRKVHSFVIH